MVINQVNYRLQHVTTFRRNENYFQKSLSLTVCSVCLSMQFLTAVHTWATHTQEHLLTIGNSINTQTQAHTHATRSQKQGWQYY